MRPSTAAPDILAAAEAAGVYDKNVKDYDDDGEKKEGEDDDEEEFWEGFWFPNRRRGRGESEERGETVADIIERADDLPAPRRRDDDD